MPPVLSPSGAIRWLQATQLYCIRHPEYLHAILRVEWEQVSQGTRLRVDVHLPITFTQAETKKEAQERAGYGILAEVITMVVLLLVIAIIAASL